jgi:hypothetical protein
MRRGTVDRLGTEIDERQLMEVGEPTGPRRTGRSRLEGPELERGIFHHGGPYRQTADEH